MDIFDAINARRSVREFLPEPVPRAVLEKIVAAAAEAPTGCNLQLKQYIIVDEPAVMAQLRPLVCVLATAPACVVLAIEPKGSKYGEYWMQDASAAMQNMLLAAVALGYAGCWIEGNMRRVEEQVRAILNVPPHLRVWSLTPVGRPKAAPPRPPKPNWQDVTHYNKY